MEICYLILLLAYVSLPSIQCNTSSDTNKILTDPNLNEDEEVLIKSLIGWIRGNNGIVNAKLGVRRNDRNSPLTFYAKQNIMERETLFTIPPACSLFSRGYQVAPEGMLIVPKVGDYVNVNRDENGEWYVGTVTNVDKPRSRLNMKYNDGTEEFLVDFDAVQLNGSKRRRGDVLCATVDRILDEIALGNESNYAPFLNYAQNVLKTNEESNIKLNLPINMWSEEGRELLWKVFQIEEGLPSYYNSSHVFANDPIWGQRDCTGSKNDSLIEKALHIQHQFGYNADVIFPFFDLLSHRNGRVMNAQISIQSAKNDVVVRSTRVIEAGEDIFVSNYDCADCSTDTVNQSYRNNYGTKNILVDYGFLEAYPQRWLIKSNHYPSVKFIIGKANQFSIEIGDQVVGDDYMVRADSAEDKSLYSFKGIHQQLLELKDKSFQSWDNVTPKHEWDLINKYLEDEIIAVDHALQSHHHACNQKENGLSDCYFDDLLAVEKDEDTPINLQLMSCTFGTMMVFDGYNLSEEIQTPYQYLMFDSHPVTKDTCLTIEPTVQICDSYRPQYHEMAVHYTAKYLKEDLKRVVFVGGGDSMLLHEVLKYPSLELVVGLEIDQTVTRKSFKYFGTQPHWDDPRVQWWYGDAAKSLLMLPREYFGTFDLILVDLSETVMSFTVSGEIDIMSALSLLLKPSGIFLKNEIYFEKLAALFPYTIQIHIYDVPVVCSQALVLGSYEVDFLAPLQNKGSDNVDILYIEPYEHDKVGMNLNEEDMLYNIWHDYRRNSTISKICMEENDEDYVNQVASPGILMILEAEDAAIFHAALTSEQVTALLQEALTKNNLGTVKHASNQLSFNDGMNDKMIIVIVLEEGYILARIWTELHYCAFDIHLWSGFDKHDAIRNSLLDAVGSSRDSSSSYRIAAGGQFGVSTWKENAAKFGPSLICPDDNDNDDKQTSTITIEVPPPTGENLLSLGTNDVDIILEESMNSLRPVNNDIKVGVICPRSPYSCRSLEKLKESKNVRELVAIRACPGMTVDNIESVLACEKDILHMLKESTSTTIEDDASTFKEISRDYKLANRDRVILSVNENDNNKVVYATIQSLNVDDTINVVYDLKSEIEYHVKRDRVQLVRSSEDSPNERNKLQVIVIDDNAPMIMGQILLSIFLNARNLGMLTHHNFLILSVFLCPTLKSEDVENESSWRKNLMKRFRTNVFMYDPVLEADVVFNGTDSVVEMSITSSGDLHLIQNLKNAIANIQSKKVTSQIIDAYIENIQGGHFNFQPNFNPYINNNFFLPKDYQNKAALKQWNTQKSLGRQTIFQLERDIQMTSEVLIDGDVLQVGDRVESLYGEEWYPGTVDVVNTDGTYYVKFDDGDEENVIITELKKIVPSSTTPELTRSHISKALLQALSYIVNLEPDSCEDRDTENNQCIAPENNNQKYEFHEFNELADGTVFFFIWHGGSILVLWDGRKHVDVNLFTYNEDEEIHKEFTNNFRKPIPFMKTILHDPQPRGVGRVVNFKDDLFDDDSENIIVPHWS